MGDLLPNDSEDVMLVAVLSPPKLPLRSPDETEDMLPCGGLTDSLGAGLPLEAASRRLKRSLWLGT